MCIKDHFKFLDKIYSIFCINSLQKKRVKHGQDKVKHVEERDKHVQERLKHVQEMDKYGQNWLNRVRI